MATVTREMPSGLTSKIKEDEATGYWVASIKSSKKPYKQTPFRPRPSIFSFEEHLDRYAILANQRVRRQALSGLTVEAARNMLMNRR